MPEARILKIIVLGDSGVGKTAILQQYVNSRFFSTFKATLGADFMMKQITIEGQLVTLQLWDTAGQERFQCLGSAFFRGSDACMLVFDVNSKQSFDRITTWYEEFKASANPKDPETFPFILVGNKIDTLPENRKISTNDAESFAKTGFDEQIDYMETSAKENINISAAFDILVRKGLNRAPAMHMDLMKSTVKIEESRQTKSNASTCDKC